MLTNLPPRRLMSGFYLNELLLKLTERCDPHPEIFFSYASCVQALCEGENEAQFLQGQAQVMDEIYIREGREGSGDQSPDRHRREKSAQEGIRKAWELHPRRRSRQVQPE